MFAQRLCAYGYIRATVHFRGGTVRQPLQERGSMYKILEKTQFSEKVFKFRIEAPAIAKHEIGRAHV